MVYSVSSLIFINSIFWLFSLGEGKDALHYSINAAIQNGWSHDRGELEESLSAMKKLTLYAFICLLGSGCFLLFFTVWALNSYGVLD
ncbi:MAG: hypothetical protein ABII97_03365 [Patescibacteria group bacterium]